MKDGLFASAGNGDLHPTLLSKIAEFANSPEGMVDIAVCIAVGMILFALWRNGGRRGRY